MNENITKENLFNKIQTIIKKNNKNLIYFLIFLFLIFILFQFYLFNQNNRILNSSLIYNDYKFNKSDLDLTNNLIKLTNQIGSDVKYPHQYTSNAMNSFISLLSLSFDIYSPSINQFP